MSTLNASNLKNPSSASNNIVLNSSGTVSVGTTIYIPSINDGPIGGARNRIINGDMRIDQRNAGISTVVTSQGYTLDRWAAAESTDGAATVIRSSTAPVGFTSSLLWTTTTADASLAAGQFSTVYQIIEGNNVSDLAWGTTNAKPITLSFWVRSSLTGTFSAGITNGALNRSYPFNYTINSANTFEYKTVTIPGDTTGTWYSDNLGGMCVIFSMGNGSTYQGTVNTWQAGYFFAVAGETQVIGTLNATWYVTGVQLELGSVATPFERRSYGQELALCQRYYCKTYSIDTVPGTVVNAGSVISMSNSGGTSNANFVHPVEMRTAPTYTLYNTATGATGTWQDGTGTARAVTSGGISSRQGYIQCTTASASSLVLGHVVASIEL